MSGFLYLAAPGPDKTFDFRPLCPSCLFGEYTFCFLWLFAAFAALLCKFYFVFGCGLASLWSL
jgi:hypothetical protein